MLAALALVWGASFFFNGVAVRELPVFTIVVGRVALAALILILILKVKGESLPADRRVWTAFFAMGLLNNAIPFSLIVWGQQHIASSLAAILNASTPLFTVVFAHFLTRDERMTSGKLVGVVAGFAGVAVMVGLNAFQALGTHIVAQLMCLAGAASYAFAGIFGRRFQAMGVTPMMTATGQVVASSVLLTPLMLVIDRPWTFGVPSIAAIGALIGVAAISTALAYVLYFQILSSAGPTNLLLVTFLIPVSAILLGVICLHESLAPKHIAGMVLIGIGLAAIDGRPWRMLRWPPARAAEQRS